jgi:hypothetical protein
MLKMLKWKGFGSFGRNAMRSLILAIFSFAALLSVSPSVSAQGTQPTPQLTPTPQPNPQLTPTPQTTPQSTPQPTPRPTPSTAASSQPTTPADYMRAWPEPGRYHPCPASVGLPNGRTVCLGLDDERRRPRARHMVRRVAIWGCRVVGSSYPGRKYARDLPIVARHPGYATSW